MRSASDYREDLENVRERVLETVKLTITKLFENHTDLVNEICLAEVCDANPIFQSGDEDFLTTCIDDVRVVDNELSFTYSSEMTDLASGEEELDVHHLIALLDILEDLDEEDLNFEE